jgi:hypothetical protein
VLVPEPRQFIRVDFFPLPFRTKRCFRKSRLFRRGGSEALCIGPERLFTQLPIRGIFSETQSSPGPIGITPYTADQGYLQIAANEPSRKPIFSRAQPYALGPGLSGVLQVLCATGSRVPLRGIAPVPFSYCVLKKNAGERVCRATHPQRKEAQLQRALEATRLSWRLCLRKRLEPDPLRAVCH